MRLQSARRTDRVGVVCGAHDSNGYRHIWLGQHGRHKAHRLAWLYVTGAWPTKDIDHINGVRDDNRWENLREASASENGMNKRHLTANNTSGVTGVYWSKAAKKWQAFIKRNGVAQYLGIYNTKDEARDVRRAAERRVFGAFAPHGAAP